MPCSSWNSLPQERKRKYLQGVLIPEIDTSRILRTPWLLRNSPDHENGFRKGPLIKRRDTWYQIWVLILDGCVHLGCNPLRILGALLQSGQGDFPVNSELAEAYPMLTSLSPSLSTYVLTSFLGISIPLKNGVLFSREGHSRGGWFNNHLLSQGAQLAQGSTQKFVINKEVLVLTLSGRSLGCDWCGPFGQEWEPGRTLTGRCACKDSHKP